MRLKGEQGLGIVDTLIVLVLISIFFGVLIPHYEKIAVDAQETALKVGLQNIRMAIGVYLIINHEYPRDLRDLINKRYIIPVRGDTIFTQEYLRSLAVDSEGRPLDPFRNPYSYDRVNGHVASTTN